LSYYDRYCAIFRYPRYEENEAAIMKHVLVALLATFVGVAGVSAQSPSGSITGSLEDPQSRAVVGAEVKAQWKIH
jgi:hypothetical protein